MQTAWTFKLWCPLNGRTVVKEVVGFATYDAAEACAKSLVTLPVIVLSYM